MSGTARTPGLVQIYTGDGKGKTTAAFGLALRALGHGKKVAVIQFMKPGGSGETRIFSALEGAALSSFGRRGFVDMKAPRDEDFRQARLAMIRAREIAAAGETDLLVLDEINNALHFRLLDCADVLNFIGEKPAAMELVLTGRNAPEALVDAADLVTEMKEIKHPWQKGIPAREGIDF